MARTLEKYTFTCDRRGRGRPALYPWDQWTDGRIYEATRGTDYTNTTKAFVSTLRAHASRKKLRIKLDIRKTSNGREKVIFQFHTSNTSK